MAYSTVSRSRSEIVFDQSLYTEERLDSLGGNLIAGATGVVLVVFFMMGWRPALIVGSALPLSIGAMLSGLTFFGEQIHQMTIFGMIIAIGLLIDNAIVMTDSVVARRRAGASAIAAVSGAVRHLFSPLFASTFTTILGFMPIFLLPGNVGDFVGPIAKAVVLALIASFALAMTVIPALAGLLTRVEQKYGRRLWRDGIHSARLGAGYQSLLTHALRRPVLTLAMTVYGLHYPPAFHEFSYGFQAHCSSELSLSTAPDILIQKIGVWQSRLQAHANSIVSMALATTQRSRVCIKP